MTIGLSERFNILQQSPHDLDPAPAEVSTFPKLAHWTPSRYNIRANTEDGRMVLWNTLSTSMSVFESHQIPAILDLLKKQGIEAREEGMVAYLVKRGFLVKKGTNEYRKLQVKFGQQHYRTDMLQLILMSSEDCNFRCKYCYEEFKRGTMKPWVRDGIKKMILNRIKSLSSLHVNWFGGEPLYGWEAIEDLGAFSYELCKQHEMVHYSHMTTNGYLLTPDKVDKLFSWNIRNFQITMDGTPEHHDCSRPTREGGPTFATIFENLKSMAKRPDPFAVRLRVNFDKVNHGSLDRFLDMVSAEFSDDSRFKVDFHAVGKWGGANDEHLEVCGDEEDAVLADLKEAARVRGIEIPTLKDVNFFGGQVCYAARPFNLLIGADGKVMKCTIMLDTDERNIVGQVHEDGRLEINEENFALWTEPAYEQDTQCQKCVVLPSCQGIHCPLIRIQQNTQPCCGTRKNPKSQLLDVLKRRQGHKVKVTEAAGG